MTTPPTTAISTNGLPSPPRMPPTPLPRLSTVRKPVLSTFSAALADRLTTFLPTRSDALAYGFEASAYSPSYFSKAFAYLSEKSAEAHDRYVYVSR